MNTADRSIALVDLALRRRFSFVEFYPDRPPVEGLLGALAAEAQRRHGVGRGCRSSAPHAKSARPAEPRIGPSYFMRRDLDEETVARIWQHDVLPYVEEQLYGEHDRLDEFALGRLRRESTKHDAPEAEAGDEPPVTEAPGSDDAQD